ncbi:MAG: L-threonylcarbamoyladenylate synthase [Pseudomonadota bacterium]
MTKGPEIISLKTPEERRRALAGATRAILAGDPVAIPTETVYGLAADAANDRAVARIYEAKGRPAFNPLIVHVADIDMAREFGEFSRVAETLAVAFWPGPLTLVLPRTSRCGLSLLVSAGLETIALRAPRSAFAQELIRSAGRPLAAPSANASGSISPTSAEHVRESLGGRIGLIIDGGPCGVGVESTIVKVEGERVTLLRPGGIARAEIARVAGRALEAPAPHAIEAPGMMQSHYAPRAPLRLGAAEQRQDEAFLGFGKIAGRPGAALNLSAAGDLVEAAANLFSHLRALDALCAEKGLAGIAAAPVPDEGLGEAINDRLARAASPRD